MDLLRSRRTMYVVAALATAGLVVTGASGLISSMGAPSGEDAASQAPDSDASPPPAPDLDELGDAPEGTSFKDLGQRCQSSECSRLIGIKSDDVEGEKAVEEVYDHLLDEGWGQALPPGEKTNPKDVPKSETYLSNGTVMIKGSPDPYAPETTAGLMLVHAQAPGG